jgi:hypothetical protein
LEECQELMGHFLGKRLIKRVFFLNSYYCIKKNSLYIALTLLKLQSGLQPFFFGQKKYVKQKIR